MDDVKTGGPMASFRLGGLWAKRPGKVNQRRKANTGRSGPKLPLLGTRDTSLP
jgi:hypothetical protein